MPAFKAPFWKMMHPFILGGAGTLLLISKLQDSMLKGPTYANDPRNPYYAELQAAKHKEEGH
ncbi:atp18 subunit J of the mitochondrial F1F0 ATP synthase [Mycoemilia scoparia]|uniref:Atp18 subunit J of the mitochondrial F1F0 ATP synthase n=1 Tax=Mycoemilia scoparia TaxID=417184 RepID=A0A9W8A1U9_9FUNG|nr:atp18 subunit J of the mitochondrial F1F0 ATP synthase [Mycoemilia scoparia]